MVAQDTPCNCLTLRQASRRVTALYDDALAPSGLRSTQYSLLAVLHRSGPCGVQQLAETLVVDRSTLGHNLRPLMRDGLIAHEVHPDDRRVRRLELTSLGKERLAEARPYWRRAQAQFEHAFGKGEAEQLRALLRRVVSDGAP